MTDPYAAYAAIDAVNISTLKHLWSKTPLHYWQNRRAPHQATPAMLLGTAIHMAVFEPDRFLTHYVVKPEGLDGRTKIGKQWNEENAGKPVLSSREHETCTAIQLALESNPKASVYLRPGKVEHALLWNDAETGTACKGRVDLLRDDGALVGLKTTRDLTPRLFQTQAAHLGYHLQWAFYHDALVVLGAPPPKVVEIVVETEPPHDVVVYVVPDDVLDIGRDEYRKALVRLEACRKFDRWPGWAEEEVAFALPKWAAPWDDGLDGLGLEGF